MEYLNEYITLFEENPGLIVFLLVWTTAWKGVALWKAGRKNSLPWFLALFLVNTLGVLPILYIFIFSNLGKGKMSDKPEKKSDSKKD